jgi:hypothetical protein
LTCQAPLNAIASLLPTPPALLQETTAAKAAPPLSPCIINVTQRIVNVTQPAVQLKATVTAVLVGATAYECACCMRSRKLLRQSLLLSLPVTAAAALGAP